MKHFLSTAGVVVVLSATSVACDKIKPPQPELQKPPATSDQTGQQEGERKAFAQAAQKELDELRDVIAGFKTKAETANLQVKARLAAEVQELEADLREMQQRLTELKSTTLESGNQLKDSFGKSLQNLKNRIDSFRKNAA